MWFSLILPTRVQNGHHHPHFTVRETEAKRSSELDSGSQSWWVGKAGLGPGPAVSREGDLDQAMVLPL